MTTWMGDQIGPAKTLQEAGLNPGDADWWWQYGLDGVVGGFVGAAVTGVAVWLTLQAQKGQLEQTLRHERELADTARLEADKASLAASVAALQTQVTFASLGLTSEVAKTRISELHATLGPVVARSHKLAPDLSEQLETFMFVLLTKAVDGDGTVDLDRLGSHLVALQVRLATWLKEPERYAAVVPPEWDLSEED